MFFFRRKKQPEDPPNVRLMKSMKFGGKDLTANRSGTMTDAQRRSVQRGQMWGALGLWSIAILLMLPVIVFATNNNMDALLLVLAALGCVAAAFWHQSKTRSVLIQNQTAAVSGPLSRKTEMVYTGKVFIPVFKITVDDKTFSVSKKIYDSFIEGEMYTLYYIPETSQLLSAELTDVHEKEKRLSDSSEEALTQFQEQQIQEDESLSY